MTANREMSCTSINDFATMPRNESGDFLLQEFDNPVVEATQFYDDETTHARIFKERIMKSLLLEQSNALSMSESSPQLPG